MNTIFQNQKELNAALRYWKRTLRIEDWDITARFRRAHQMQPGAVGDCQIDLQNKTARVSLVPFIDHDESYPIPYNAQRTLVHELLHVVMARVKPESNEELEVVINQLSRVLVGAA